MRRPTVLFDVGGPLDYFQWAARHRQESLRVAEQLALAKGKEVFVVIKASNVMLATE